MKLKRLTFAPFWIALLVVCSVCTLELLRLDFLERLECFTYDIRVRQALLFNAPASSRFGFVYIDESTIRAIENGSLGYRFGLYWPRQVYGRVLEELTAQKTSGMALDVIFGELRHDHPPVQFENGALMDSDEYFARALRSSPGAILALNGEVEPPDLFLTNAPALGDISTEKDADGVLRRARAFRVYRSWHPAFRQLEAESGFGVDLGRARVEKHRIVLPREGAEEITIPLDLNGEFDLADFAGSTAAKGRKAKPFIEKRVWHMGVVLAARALGLNLDTARIDLDGGWIVLTGPGLERRIPVDRYGRFYVDWALTPNDPRLLRRPLQEVLGQHRNRLHGEEIKSLWKDRLVLIGSAAAMGNDLTDRGATPFSPDTLLVSKHWNVANAFLQNRFVRRAPAGVSLTAIVIMAALSAIVTWKMRAINSLIVVLLLAGFYLVFGTALFIQTRYWIPMVLPVLGALLMTHVLLVTWRVVFEQADKRRVAAVLQTIVSPKIARELLGAEKLSLGGARREITVLFADVRGFTEFTDSSQERAEEHVRSKGLSAAEIEAYHNEQARATLATVNLYLGTVADVIVSNDGTLDKFIGDCVMAFWGAPTANQRHAAACVRAAVEAQRAIERLNNSRAELNAQIELENKTLRESCLEPRPTLPILWLGMGINTGMATVGLMGSEVQAVVRQGNYTVFGREVNLASRLENLSGKGHIYISRSTWEQLRRDDPDLARLCAALPPVTVKGIRSAVEIFEVKWDGAPLNSPGAGNAGPGSRELSPTN